jgi:hypothetical protein
VIHHRTDAPSAEELKAASDAVAKAGENVKALKAAGATNKDDAVVAGVATLKELKAKLAAMEVAAGIAPEPAPEKPKPAQQKKGGNNSNQNNQKKKGGNKGGDASSEGAGTSSAEEVKALRIAKVAQLRDAGAEPFAYRFDRTHTASELQAMHADLENGAEVEGTVEAVCGRVKARRVFGKLAFLSLEDDGGSIQLYCDKKRIDAEEPGAFKRIVDLVDMGDIVGARGTVKRTEKGELSVAVDSFEMLTKSLLPLPDKFKGLTDVEMRYRQRYVDLIANPEVRDTFPNSRRDRQRHTKVPGRQVLHGDGDARAGVQGGGRRRQAVQYFPQRARHEPHAAHRHRAAPQETRRRRVRARVRDGPDLPQRGYQHQAQSRVYQRGGEFIFVFVTVPI